MQKEDQDMVATVLAFIWLYQEQVIGVVAQSSGKVSYSKNTLLNLLQNWVKELKDSHYAPQKDLHMKLGNYVFV